MSSKGKSLEVREKSVVLSVKIYFPLKSKGVVDCSSRVPTLQTEPSSGTNFILRRSPVFLKSLILIKLVLESNLPR